MKKVVLVLSFVFVFMLGGSAYAMSYQEFIDVYPNEYIYRVNFPDGTVNYFSSPYELDFYTVEYLPEGVLLESGEALVVSKPSSIPLFTVYRLKDNGDIHYFNERKLVIRRGGEGYVGFEGNIDIYRWTDNGFFLPIVSTFMRDPAGAIQTILPLGFGLLSVSLSIRLLVDYLKRYLHRLV